MSAKDRYEETPRLTLRVRGMSCRHCVREVTARLRDVPGVQTVSADASASLVALGGSMLVSDVLAAFHDSSYDAEVIESSAAASDGQGSLARGGPGGTQGPHDRDGASGAVGRGNIHRGGIV